MSLLRSLATPSFLRLSLLDGVNSWLNLRAKDPVELILSLKSNGLAFTVGGLGGVAKSGSSVSSNIEVSTVTPFTS